MKMQKKSKSKFKSKKLLLGAGVVALGALTSLYGVREMTSSKLYDATLKSSVQEISSVADMPSMTYGASPAASDVSNFIPNQTTALKYIADYQAATVGYTAKKPRAVNPGVVDGMLGQGAYMPFMDIGQFFESTTTNTLNLMRQKQQLLQLGFLVSPDEGFSSESNGGGDIGDAGRNIAKSMNFDSQHYTAIDSSRDYDIPVTAAGFFPIDFVSHAHDGWDSEANAASTVDVLDSIREMGGDYIYSVGGWRGNTPAVAVEIAQTLANDNSRFNEYYLAAMYAYMIRSMDLNFLGFDIEGSDALDDMSNPSSGDILYNTDNQADFDKRPPMPGGIRNAQDMNAGKGVFKEIAPTPEQTLKMQEGAKKAKNLRLKALKIIKSLPEFSEKVHIHFTIPILPNGLRDGTNQMVVDALNNGLVDKVDFMIMDYGIEKQSTLPGQMAIEGISAINAVINKWKNDPTLKLPKDDSLYKKIGIIPMIGKNDVAYEVFYVTDAKILTNWAISHNVGYMSDWLLIRDFEEEMGAGGILAGSWASLDTSRRTLDQLDKPMVDIPVEEMATGLAVTSEAYGKVFKRFVENNPVPLSEIVVSDEFKLLLEKVGIASVADIFTWNGEIPGIGLDGTVDAKGNPVFSGGVLDNFKLTREQLQSAHDLEVSDSDSYTAPKEEFAPPPLAEVTAEMRANQENYNLERIPTQPAAWLADDTFKNYVGEGGNTFKANMPFLYKNKWYIALEDGKTSIWDGWNPDSQPTHYLEIPDVLPGDIYVGISANDFILKSGFKDHFPSRKNAITMDSVFSNHPDFSTAHDPDIQKVTIYMSYPKDKTSHDATIEIRIKSKYYSHSVDIPVTFAASVQEDQDAFWAAHNVGSSDFVLSTQLFTQAMLRTVGASNFSAKLPSGTDYSVSYSFGQNGANTEVKVNLTSNDDPTNVKTLSYPITLVDDYFTLIDAATTQGLPPIEAKPLFQLATGHPEIKVLSQEYTPPAAGGKVGYVKVNMEIQGEKTYIEKKVNFTTASTITVTAPLVITDQRDGTDKVYSNADQALATNPNPTAVVSAKNGVTQNTGTGTIAPIISAPDLDGLLPSHDGSHTAVTPPTGTGTQTDEVKDAITAAHTEIDALGTTPEDLTKDPALYDAIYAAYHEASQHYSDFSTATTVQDVTSIKTRLRAPIDAAIAAYNASTAPVPGQPVDLAAEKIKAKAEIDKLVGELYRIPLVNGAVDPATEKAALTKAIADAKTGIDAATDVPGIKLVYWETLIRTSSNNYNDKISSANNKANQDANTGAPDSGTTQSQAVKDAITAAQAELNQLGLTAPNPNKDSSLYGAIYSAYLQASQHYSEFNTQTTVADVNSLKERLKAPIDVAVTRYNSSTAPVSSSPSTQTPEVITAIGSAKAAIAVLGNTPQDSKYDIKLYTSMLSAYITAISRYSEFDSATTVAEVTATETSIKTNLQSAVDAYTTSAATETPDNGNTDSTEIVTAKNSAKAEIDDLGDVTYDPSYDKALYDKLIAAYDAAKARYSEFDSLQTTEEIAAKKIEIMEPVSLASEAYKNSKVVAPASSSMPELWGLPIYIPISAMGGGAILIGLIAGLVIYAKRKKSA